MATTREGATYPQLPPAPDDYPTFPDKSTWPVPFPDLPPNTKSGLVDALQVLDGVPGIVTVRFNDVDVVRHPLVAEIVRAYDRQGAGASRPDR